jgi:hypothetical protein
LKLPFTSFHPARQRGAAAVEFALVAVVFFGFVFGVLEVARGAFLWSTLTQVMNRAARGAAMANPSDATAMALVRRNAMFNTGGKLALGGDIDTSYLHIDYLARDGTTAVTVLPPCPVQNIANCINDPNSSSCIRFVRVSLCMPGTNCTPVRYTSLVGLDILAAFHLDMPTFTTVVAAQTLGMTGTCTP